MSFTRQNATSCANLAADVCFRTLISGGNRSWEAFVKRAAGCPSLEPSGSRWMLETLGSMILFVEAQKDAPAEALYNYMAQDRATKTPWSALEQHERAAVEIFRATYLILLPDIADPGKMMKPQLYQTQLRPDDISDDFFQVGGVADRVELGGPMAPAVIENPAKPWHPSDTVTAPSDASTRKHKRRT
jgi:hypothetical protein